MTTIPVSIRVRNPNKSLTLHTFNMQLDENTTVKDIKNKLLNEPFFSGKICCENYTFTFVFLEERRAVDAKDTYVIKKFKDEAGIVNIVMDISNPSFSPVERSELLSNYSSYHKWWWIIILIIVCLFSYYYFCKFNG